MTRHNRIETSIKSAALVMATSMALVGCNRNLPGRVSSGATKADKERYELAVKQGFDYKYMQSKVKLTFKGKSLNGTMRMEKGKFFSLSVNAPLLGFEVGRIEVDKDSVKVINKVNKVYLAESLADARAKYSDEMNIEAIQCLFLGRIYVPGRGEASNRDFKRFSWNELANPLLTGIYSQHADYTLTYTINADNRLNSTALEMTNNNTHVQWSYSDYTSVQEGAFPQKESIAVNLSGKALQAGIQLNAPTFPKSGISRFEITNAYKKVTGEQMMEQFKKLK